jgi:hypothetical protein
MLGSSAATYRKQLNRNGLVVKIFLDKGLAASWRFWVDFQLPATSFQLPVLVLVLEERRTMSVAMRKCDYLSVQVRGLRNEGFERAQSLELLSVEVSGRGGVWIDPDKFVFWVLI